MTRCRRLTALTTSLLLSLASGAACKVMAAEPEQLTWGLTAFPLLLDSSTSANGQQIDLLDEITRHMPNYQHHRQQMNISRALVELEKRNDLCIVGVQRNAERDKIGYFVGLFLSLPPQLVFRKNDQQTISNGEASVSLKQLLQRTDLKGALLAGRNYGPELTPLLETAEEQGRIMRIQTSGSGSNLLDMLEHHRIDYTLEYAEALRVMQSVPEVQPIIQSLRMLPLQEARTPIISGIYCPRTEQGKQLIRQIDSIATTPEVLAHFTAAMESFTPSSIRQHYSPWFEDYQNNRATRSYTNLED